MQRRYLFVIIITFFAFCLTTPVQAQKSKLLIQINNDQLQPTDTLDFVANYKLGDKQLPPATLALVLKENNGDGIWQLRWPMIDGHAEGSLAFPKNIAKGNYTLYFALQPRFFRVYGRVLYPPGIKKLTGAIYSPDIIPKELSIPVENGNFKVDNFLFQNSVIFELDIEEKKKMPAITIDAWLDSAFQPAASTSKEITIGMGDSSVMENKKVENWLAFFDPYYQTTILGNMPAAQKFDSVYVSPLFKKNIIKQFDCLGDSTLIKSKGLEDFLGKYFSGFKMDEVASEYQTPTAKAGEYRFIFYLDEHKRSISTLNNIRLSDIATIKILPPIITSMDDFEKKQTIIALYTKQGPFWGQDFYRYRYIINGYQPAIYQLPPNRKMFATNPYFLF